MFKNLGDGYNIDFLRNLDEDELPGFADSVREIVLHNISKTGGHLGSSLGVIELTVALHYVFNTPVDKLIWDVGHQTYPHKLLTDRAHSIASWRTPGGLSGFAKRSESEYDVFGAGHSSTSISAGLGHAIARDLNGGSYEVVSIIGDASIASGMAFEAINHAGDLKPRLIIVLNDNAMSISKTVGAMRKLLSKLLLSKPYLRIRSGAKSILNLYAGLYRIIHEKD